MFTVECATEQFQNNSKGFVVKLQILDSHKFNSQAIAITHPLHLYLICNVMLRLQLKIRAFIN